MNHIQSSTGVTGFLSYAWDDMDPYRLLPFIKDLENYINHHLPSHHKFRIQYDQNDLRQTGEFWPAIKDLISKSRIYFVVLSPRFIHSSYLYAEYEAIKARKGPKQIYFFCIERKMIPEEFWWHGIGEEIRRQQIIDLPPLADWYPKENLSSEISPDQNFPRDMQRLQKLSIEIADFIKEHSSGLQPLSSRRLVIFGALGTVGTVILKSMIDMIDRPPPAPPGQDHAQKVIWQMVDVFSHNERNATSVFGAKHIADLINKMTNGQFQIHLHNTQAKDSNLLDLVDQGKIHCAYAPSYYYAEKYPSLIFGTAVPFGLNTQQQLSWLNYSYPDENEYEIEECDIKLKVMQRHYKDLGLNVIPLTAGGTGGQMGGWFRTLIPDNVETFADYAKTLPHQKFRFRIAGLGGEIISEGHEKNIVISRQIGKEIAHALEIGQLDAAEWIGPLEDQAINLKTVKGMKYYYYPGWWDPGTIYALQVNLQAWKELPLSLKLILKAACLQACHDILAHYDNNNSMLLKSFASKETDVRLRQFPDKLLKVMQQKSVNYLDQKFGKESQASDIDKNLYSEWKAYRSRIGSWYAHVDSCQIRGQA